MSNYRSQTPAMSPRNMHGYGATKDYDKMDMGMLGSDKYEGVDRMPLAMAYVPWQRWKNVYDLNKALEIGTIFPELNLPYTGRRGDR